MKQVLIAKALAYAAKGDHSVDGNPVTTGTAADPSELAAGAVGIFAVGGDLITSSTALADVKQFFVAVGTTDSVNSTVLFQRSGGFNFSKASYKDPIKQVSTVTLSSLKFVQDNGTGAAAATYQNSKRGEEAIVRVIDTMPGTISPSTKSYSTAVVSGDTPTTVTERLVSQINKDNDRVVTASSNGAVLTVTDKRVGGHFRLAIDGILVNGATIEYPTPFYPGSGSADELTKAERLSLAGFNNVWEQAGGRGALAVPFQTAAGGKYDQYLLDILNQHASKDGMNGMYNRLLQVIIAFPESNAPAEFTAVIGKLLNAEGTANADEVTAEDETVAPAA